VSPVWIISGNRRSTARAIASEPTALQRVLEDRNQMRIVQPARCGHDLIIEDNRIARLFEIDRATERGIVMPARPCAGMLEMHFLRRVIAAQEAADQGVHITKRELHILSPRMKAIVENGIAHKRGGCPFVA
jgi:hypothetical protein